ncbi:hypothetical protein [Curtobacterium sp. MCBD17_032]|uniref:hypothetical protein n=1 Tax=Curtobacterium sp. MCBD17_032 TaxID=2175659 RepID=UPI000DA82FFF|nr:hypothetical protein [Curtobacterium sp. MCBD17_032]PZE82410.1 hypothetical protein DEI91_11295 [Curtobacterium sp. MCBD17_032]
MSDWQQVPPLPLRRRPDRDVLGTALVWMAVPMQVVLTGFLTFVVVAVWSIVGGAFTEVLQFIGWAVLSTPLTLLVFALGLPLRLVPRVRAWWIRRAAWTFVLFGVAVAGLVLSYVVGTAGPVHTAAVADQPATDGYVPDPRVFLPALGVFAFATMHLLPPLRIASPAR